MSRDSDELKSIDMLEVYKEYASHLKKPIAELTKIEKQMALINHTIENGVTLGIYEIRFRVVE
jgi:hypothetical protein